MHAAVQTGSFAAPRLRRDVREQRVAAGVEAAPTDPPQPVGEHRRADERDKTDEDGRTLKKQTGDHHPGFAPTVAPMADHGTDDYAGRGKAGEHHADDKR